jgi:tRNA dimethylallyltransferase
VLSALERIERRGVGEGQLPRSSPYPGKLALIGISRPRDVLYRRIDQRAAELFAAGLLDEVASLLAAGVEPQSGPMTSHGYVEAVQLLAGKISAAEAVAGTARRTRQYAKRQLSWFRGDPRILWIPAGDRAADDRAIVDRAVDLVRRLVG